MGRKKLTAKKSKRLTVKESKRLVWTTFLEFWIVGVIVYFATNPSSIVLLLACCPVALYAIVNFWRKSEWVPTRLHSPVPTVFMPTAFLTGFAALVMGIVNEQIFNSCTLALAVMCVLCTMVTYPESGYADVLWVIFWNEKSSHYHVAIFKKIFYKYNSSYVALTKFSKYSELSTLST